MKCIFCSFADANSGGNTYLYEFQHDFSFLHYVDWVNASHIDDLYSVLGEVFMKPLRDLLNLGDFDDIDRKVRDDSQKYFANFAYTG